MSKQFVSLDQALNYLQYLNNNDEAFSGKQFKPSQFSNQPKNKPALIKKPTQIPKPQVQSLNNENSTEQAQGKKTLNKNRAIKRIIDTSKQILSANYKYQQPPQNDKKSFITQFNIYLKQYNRLSEQLLAQEHQREEQKRLFIQREEELLEDVYSYTVEEDFRELVEVSILKDKINKTNVQMVMDTFKLSLVVVKPNQMKIFQKSKEQSHRDIKLHQIQNVDYFSQPYIFTVMTIVKDKSSTSEFLCFRFDCLEKQHKWDRAIYCNYITRKMKKRGRYFLLEFPEKEEEKQNNQGLEHVIKKRDDIRNYDVDRKKIVKNLHSQKDKERSREGTRMGTMGMDSQRDLPSEKRSMKMERFNTENQINLISPTRQNINYNMLSTKNADQKPYFQSGLKSNRKKITDIEDNQQQDLSASHKTSKPNTAVRPNQNPPNTASNSNSVINPNNGNQNQPNSSPNNQNGNTNSQNPSMTPNLEGKQNQPNAAKETEMKAIFVNEQMAQSEIEIESKGQKQAVNPYTKRKIELRQKHEKGIKITKIKFFADKPKLLYLGNDELEYWDFDQSTFHKSQKKLIPFKDLKTYKLVKQKTTYILFELTNKNLQFAGKVEDLNDIIEWIQLQKKEKQFEVMKPKTVKQDADQKIRSLFIL